MSFAKVSNSVLKLVNKVFGIAVTYIHASDTTSTEIKGVFDNAWVEIQGTSTLKPVLKIELSSLEQTPVNGDLVEINSVTYTVLDCQPDAHGSATLILEKA